jgi:hypothetical protein
VNVAKSKVMRVTRRENADNLNITVNGVGMEEVECFRYFGVDIDRDGFMKSEMKHRVREGMKVSGILRKMWKGVGLSIDSKRVMYESIVAPTLLYGSEVWATSVAERRRMEVMSMKCMRAMCGVSIMDRVRNEDIRRRCGSEISIEKRMDRNVLRWCGHVRRMEEERLVKSI